MNKYAIPERSLEPPEEEPLPRCPVCGEETDTFILDYHGHILGCDCCTFSRNAWEVA